MLGGHQRVKSQNDSAKKDPEGSPHQSPPRGCQNTHHGPTRLILNLTCVWEAAEGSDRGREALAPRPTRDGC